MAATHDVTISADGQLAPSAVTIASGDTVKWKNDDIAAHVLNFTDGDGDKNIEPGDSFEKTFTATAKYKVDGKHPHAVVVS